MRIGGIIDLSTKDIPGKVCMVIFTVGCNFNCRFCHNKHLLVKGAGQEYRVKDLIKIIKNNYLVSSVSITGGEPTLQPEIVALCKEIKKLGKYVSIDTNGSHPEIIETLIPYINRLALDLKGSLNITNYERITSSEFNLGAIKETFELINGNKQIDFEIRTTFVEELLNPRDIHKIIEFLRKNYFTGIFVLQQYQFSEGVGEDFKDEFHKPEHKTLLDIVEPYLDQELSFQIYIRDEVESYTEIHEIFSKIL